jgi:galactokinase
MLDQLIQKWYHHFEGLPKLSSVRHANIIGEHTDYNEGGFIGSDESFVCIMISK